MTTIVCVVDKSPVGELSEFVARKLRELRKKAGLTQEELANRCDVHRNTVRGFEAGEFGIRLETIATMADALGAPLSAMLPPPKTEPIAKLVDSYMTSPWAQIDKPTKDEEKWLRESPAITWIGDAPNEETIHFVLEAHRKSTSG